MIDEISFLKRQLEKLDERVKKLEHISYGLCGNEVMGGKKEIYEGVKNDEIILKPICWHCASGYKLKEDK